MRSAVVLFCGFRGLNAEVCKNLVLSGVNVGIQDSENVLEEDLGANFFLKPDAVGKNRAEAAAEYVRELNPLVTVSTITCPTADLTEEQLDKFTLICACDLALKDQVKLNALSRSCGKKFLAAASLGFSAYVFADLGDTVSVLIKEATGEENEDGEKEFKYSPHEMHFCSLEQALKPTLSDLSAQYRVRKRRKANGIRDLGMGINVLEILAAIKVQLAFEAAAASSPKSLDDDSVMGALVADTLEANGIARDGGGSVAPSVVLELARAACRGTELSPVCAVVGGIIGQELIKAISGKDKPIQNMFFFDGLSGAGVIRKLSP